LFNLTVDFSDWEVAAVVGKFQLGKATLLRVSKVWTKIIRYILFRL